MQKTVDLFIIVSKETERVWCGIRNGWVYPEVLKNLLLPSIFISEKNALSVIKKALSQNKDSSNSPWKTAVIQKYELVLFEK